MEKKNNISIAVRCFIALVIMFVSGKVLGAFISGLLEGQLPETALKFIKGSAFL